MRRDDDYMAPARGCLRGIVIGLGFWLLGFAAVLILFL